MSTTATTTLTATTAALSSSSPSSFNKSILYSSRKAAKVFFSQLYHHLITILKFLLFFLPDKRPQRSTAQKIPLQTQYYKNKTLILDLDETLVHSVRLGTDIAYQTKVSPSIKRKNIEVLLSHNDKQPSLIYEVYKRPHVDFFLKTISQWYKVVVYTASMAEYADPVIDWLDQDNLISQRFFRQSCVLRNGNFLKDITLAEEDLCKVCLVDNSPIAFDLYKENGITLPTWISNPNDESLLDLLPFLDALRFTADVRSILRLQHNKKCTL
ncbi:MAG: NLI interacting factor-like phosphatase-domain-containing protein [Benjaminiella poitrasii]|nr:MAG: NLI interacting factor-like phosphatase-domain-containing protein [Benjaminiella poitrasii]